MRSVLKICMLLVLLTAYGCDRYTPGVRTMHPTLQEFASLTKEPTVIIPTAVELPRTPPPTETLTLIPQPSVTKIATPIPTAEKMIYCSNGTQPITPPANFWIEGALVYQDPETTGFFLVSGGPPAYSRILLASDRVYQSWGVSPDGEWLAYAFEPDDRISETQVMPYFLLSKDGDFLEKQVDISPYLSQIPPGNEFRTWLGWWNSSDSVSIAFQYQFPIGDTWIDYIYAILDPYEATWQDDLMLELEGIDVSKRLYISPDQTRLFYLRTSGRLVLWNLLEHQEVKVQRFDPIDRTGPQLVWSPDSTLAASISWLEDKITIFSRNGGQPMQTIEIPKLADVGEEQVIWDMEFSPDSKRLSIATVINHQGLFAGRGMIYVWELVSENLVYQCEISGGYYELGWSPDGKYMFTKGANPLQQETPLLVFDVQNGAVISLVPNADGVAWLNHFDGR